MATSAAQQAGTAQPAPLELKLAHSPDSDDAFMFYGLATHKVRSEDIRFTHVLEDIQTLNQKALQGVYDITAISFGAYPFLAERYILLPCGASFGDRYGPVVVSRGPLGPGGLKRKRVAAPGALTTAYLALLLYEPEVEPLFIPFDQILDRVAGGDVDAGLLIHEGQLTYAEQGLSEVVDLGEWWYQETRLPLPLGGNAIRRSLERATAQKAARLLKASIQYGLDHREEALAYAMQFSRGLDAFTTDKFVSMYVNDWTLDYGDRGREAVQTLLDRGFERGLLPGRVKAEFLEY